ncbi:MAG: peptidoglycan editing factor PgeF [Anaerolineales bacterium]|jgi:YfiH family protein
MPFHQIETLRFFQFDSLADSHLVHAVFSRHGGVSPTPWNSLNVGATVGDEGERVAENRRRIFSVMHRNPDSLYDVWQIHSARCVVAREPRGNKPYHQADAILTDVPGLTLLMRFADCVPILLYDPGRQVIGLAHAGWIGTARCVAQSAVQGMIEHFSCDPAEILAALGPSIGPDHYEVGADVISAVRKVFPGKADLYLNSNGDSTYFDLWAANHGQLKEMGVRHIEVAGICTACHTGDWYSHRAENGLTGRFGALIGLG